MKLHEALRKVIRHFGVNVIEEKRLMSFLADYKAFDDYPAVKEVMRAIATGDSGKKICLAADGSDEEFLRIANEIRETLIREKSFREEFARYAVDSVSFALGIVSSVTEPSDHGYEAAQRNTGSQGSSGAQESKPQGEPESHAGYSSQAGGPQTPFVVSGDTWQTASDGAESHRRFYRGHDLTAAFDSGEFSRNVADGSFRDIFPGDFIIKKVTIPDIKAPDGSVYIASQTYTVKFIIADLDIAMKQGSPRVTDHHAVIVPEVPVFDAYMNPSESASCGYAGSYMHIIVLRAFARGLIGAFGAEHLLSCRFDGAGRESDPLSCTCRLMTLSMVFKNDLPYWLHSWYLTFLDGVQLAAFSLHPDLKGKGMCYWVSDVHGRSFANVDGRCNGVQVCTDLSANVPCGVRPFAMLVGTDFPISGDTWQTASDGAASHRRFYRGHDLTAAFDSGEFSKNVADGSFRDIFPGDYIIKKVPIPDIEAPISYSNGSFHIAGKTYTIKFIIADLDALRNNMDSRVKTHHAVIIPEEPPFDSYMNPTNRNGYASSFMNTEIMPAFAKGLAAAFGASHMLRFNADRQVCTCRLMSLHMVFGHQYFSKVYPSDDYLGGKQFAVFRLNSDLKSKHTHYWLSDDYSNAGFAYASEYVGAYCASSMDGVRPFALLT